MSPWVHIISLNLQRLYFVNIYYRFATEEYTNDPEVIGNNFIHLTNFSINKDSGNFVNNSNPEEPEVTQSGKEKIDKNYF